MISSIVNTLKKFFEVIDDQITKRIIYLFFILIFVSILELLSLGLLPTLVAKIFSSSSLPPIIDNFLEFLNISNLKNLTIFISFIFLFKFFSLFYANYFELLTLKKLKVLVSKSILQKYSKKKYNFFIQNNSSLLSRNILVECDHFVGLIQSIMIVLKETVLLIVIFALLMVYEPIVSIIILLIFILASTLFYVSTDKILKNIGYERVKSQGLTYKLVNQFFNLIKEIKILKKENFFNDKFLFLKNRFESKILIANLITRSPKIVFELLVIIIFLSLMLYLSKYDENTILESLPFLSLIVICVIRLLPSFNAIAGALTHFQSYLNSFNLIYDQIKNSKQDKNNTNQENFRSGKSVDKDVFLEIKDLNFQYSDTAPVSIDIKNFVIKKHEMVGIIGQSGSGKTTFINLILNLLYPKRGEILFYKNFRDFKIGHVPQDIEILDGTLRDNIAFGIKEENINNIKIYEVVKKSGLQNFFEKNNSNLDLMLGERGVKISGGEKQRIGIARSLYIDPDFLIFDEATSSLDIVTEKILLEEIEKLRGNITTIFISHRISALDKCNTVYLINSGKIIDKGSSQELLEKYPDLTISKK